MERYLSYFFPGECYDKVIRDFNIFDVDCLSFALVRYLSLSILVGAVGVKLPQIIKILRSSSVEGLSYMSFLFELAAVTITSAYNFAKQFPFSTWGESFFISVQVVIILIMMLAIHRKIVYLVLFVLLYSGAVFLLTSEHITIELHQTLQGSTILLVIISRMIQMITTYQNGTTGQLAFLTALLNWVGTGARIFTTIKETMDPLMLSTYVVGFSLNSVIMFQFIWYWNVTITDAKKRA